MHNKQKEEETIEKLNIFPPENLVEVLCNSVYKISKYHEEAEFRAKRLDLIITSKQPPPLIALIWVLSEPF